jgi:hypothetical protein
MNLCDDPYSIPVIDIDEYVGSSLFTLNTNFTKLKDEVCRLDNEAALLQPSYSTLTKGVCALTTIRPGFARAWVKFNGVGASNNLTRFSSYNVASVSGNGSGTYVLTFSPSFTGTNYAVVGTCEQSTQTNNYGWVSVLSGSFTTNTVTVCIRNTAGSTTTSSSISILAYDL